MSDDRAARKRASRSRPLWVRYQEWRHYWKNPAAQRRLWADYAHIRRWRRDVAGAFPPVQGDRVALISSMSAYIYGNKLEAMLALGLRLRGWKTPILLHTRKDIVQRRLFNAFGFEDFIYWEDFDGKDGHTPEEIDREMDAWLGRDLTIQDIKQWTIGPCWLGPQIISMLHRRRRQVELDLNSAEVRDGLRDVVRYALVNAHRAEAILDQVRPHMLLLMEPNYAMFAPLVDHAVDRKLRVIQMVQPNRDDAMYFWRLDLGTRREHAATVPAATLQRLAATPWTPTHEDRLREVFESRYSGKWFLQKRNQIDSVSLSRQELDQRLGLDPAKKIVTVFSHVLWDANLFYGTDLFEDYGDWFVQTVRAAYANPEVNWLIKLHPANVYKRRQEGTDTELAELTLLREKCGPVPPHVHILAPDCGISSLSLYEISDCGVTVRGTCGLEIPCFGKPVLTAGTGRYSGLGFTLDSTTRKEYLARLAEVQFIQPLTDQETLLARQHAYTLFLRRPWKMRSFRAEFNEDLKAAAASSDPLAHNLLPVPPTAHELLALGDLAKWADWAEHGTTPDYLDGDDEGS